MNPKLLTQRHPRCGKKNEWVFFWLAWLTPGQVETLRTDRLDVVSIVANIEAEGLYIGLDPRAQSNDPDLTKALLVPTTRERSSRGVEKRSKVNVVEQSVADSSLNFLSTAPGKQMQSTYKYFAQAGAGVTVLVIDTGLGRTSSDIGRARIIDRIYAVDIPVDSRESDLSAGRVGTCVAQKIGGVTFGVAKKAKLAIVTAKPNYGSVISALAEVIFYLDGVRDRLKQKTRGWTVINLRMSFLPNTREQEAIVSQRFKELLEPLVNDHQAIVVTTAAATAAAGEDADGGDPSDPNNPTNNNNNNKIKTYPAKLSLTHDIVVVGAVLVSSSKVPSQNINGISSYPGSSSSSSSSSVIQGEQQQQQNIIYAPANGLCDRAFSISIPNNNNNYNNDDDDAVTTTGPRDGSSSSTSGSILSTAIVSGLVAYFLSLPDLANNKFRKGGVNTPAAVIEYLQQMSYSRGGGGSGEGGGGRLILPAAVWNGLDAEDRRPFYKDWYGTFPGS